MAGRPCEVCRDAQKMMLAADLIAQALSDQKIADQLGLLGNAGRMCVARHRARHIIAPARAIAAAANKDRDVVERRKQALEAAESGDTIEAFLGLKSIVGDLRGVSERLERTAAAAEGDGQRVAVAALSNQQHKNLDLRGRIGGLPGLAPPKVQPGEGVQFAVNFHFSGGRTETLSVTAPGRGPTVEHGGGEFDEDEVPTFDGKDFARALREAPRDEITPSSNRNVPAPAKPKGRPAKKAIEAKSKHPLDDLLDL